MSALEILNRLRDTGNRGTQDRKTDAEEGDVQCDEWRQMAAARRFTGPRSCTTDFATSAAAMLAALPHGCQRMIGSDSHNDRFGSIAGVEGYPEPSTVLGRVQVHPGCKMFRCAAREGEPPLLIFRLRVAALRARSPVPSKLPTRAHSVPRPFP